MRRLTDIECIASILLQQCIEKEPDEIMLGSLRAIELVRIAMWVLTMCPRCETEAFLNDDECMLCALAQNIRRCELVAATRVQEEPLPKDTN